MNNTTNDKTIMILYELFCLFGSHTVGSLSAPFLPHGFEGLGIDFATSTASISGHTYFIVVILNFHLPYFLSVGVFSSLSS